MSEETMIVEWFASFGSSPIHPRIVIDHAIEVNRRLLDGIMDAAALDPDHPHPEMLAAWLTKNENRFLTISGATYRFSKLGHRWRLLLVPQHYNEEAAG